MDGKLTLIKSMEEKGIGRPSTYAPTLGTLLNRRYLEKEQNRLAPTALGTMVTDLMVQFFDDVMDMNFTAKMEEELDQIAPEEQRRLFGTEKRELFVRPPKGTATAPALFLVPTNSYLAYANIHVFKI